MRIGLVVNPASGRGGARAAAERISTALVADGHDVPHWAIDRAGDEDTLAVMLNTCECALIVGGDGTLHALLPTLMRTRTPVYVVPTGTENLFAGHLGMGASVTAIRRAIGDFRTGEIDLGECSGRPFALMCGVGFDGAVINSLARSRQGAIRHSSYLPHMWRCANATMPRLAVEVDGRTIVDDVPGSVIIANSPRFALKANPACRARLDDGVLDVVFMPALRGWNSMAWLLDAKLGRHVKVKGLVYATGTRARVACDPTRAVAACQIDGESAGELARPGGPGDELECIVRARALRVVVTRESACDVYQ